MAYYINLFGVIYGATTLTIMTFSIMAFNVKALSMKGLFATLSIMTFSINGTQHYSTVNVIVLNVAFYLLI